MADILRERERQVYRKGEQPFQLDCEKQSVAGSVSQRACVFCGSRVVLYPIADALHIVHGPIGCASYTWDIRGALSSGPELHRLSFSTDLRELDVIQGGEKKLYAALCELIDAHQPKAAFVYATCIVGIIGDDVEAVCKRVSREKGIPVLPVHSEGFKGTKKDGYRAACDALFQLIGTAPTDGISPISINILGDFNLAGEIWMIREYFRRMGVEVVSCITGDGRVDDIRRAHGAALNVVQCSGSMTHLAKSLKEKWGTPFIRVSYFGIEDMAQSLYDVARFFKDPAIMQRTQELVRAGDRSHHAHDCGVPAQTAGQESGDLCRRRLQSVLTGARSAIARHADRDWSDRKRAIAKTTNSFASFATKARSSSTTPIRWNLPAFCRKKKSMSLSGASRNVRSLTSSGSASVTTTTNARKPLPALRAW